MNIELLVVPNCPNEQAAASLLRTAMDEIGLSHDQFRTIVIADADAAERTGFTGSPTFMVDGVDLFEDPARPTGMSCRLYRQPEGVAGVPRLRELRQALKRISQ